MKHLARYNLSDYILVFSSSSAGIFLFSRIIDMRVKIRPMGNFSRSIKSRKFLSFFIVSSIGSCNTPTFSVLLPTLFIFRCFCHISVASFISLSSALSHSLIINRLNIGSGSTMNADTVLYILKGDYLNVTYAKSSLP